MTCHVCGSHLSSIYTDIPIETGERSIVILKIYPFYNAKTTGNT